jgi:hypothetical protein
MKPAVKTRRNETTNFSIKRFRFLLKVRRIRRRWKGGKKVRMKLMLNVYTVQVCSLKTATVKTGYFA